MLTHLALAFLLAAPPASPCDTIYRAPDSGSAEESHQAFARICVLRLPRPEELGAPRIDLGPLDAAEVEHVADELAGICRDLVDTAGKDEDLDPYGRLDEWLADAARLPFAAHRDWLAGVLWEVAHIEPGSRRSELGDRFVREGGIATKTQGSYMHCACEYIQAEIRFAPSEEAPDLMSSAPEDLVVEVEKVVFDLSQAD